MAGAEYIEIDSSIKNRRFTVFLSFKSEHLRESFRDHLSSALKNAFKFYTDEGELKRAEDSLELIKRSKISTVVLSKDYSLEVFKATEESRRSLIVLDDLWVEEGKYKNQRGVLEICISVKFGITKETDLLILNSCREKREAETEIETEEETVSERNLLHIACKKGNQTLVEKLVLQDRSMCFQRDSLGMTPLHIAAKQGRLDILKTILKYYPMSVKELTAVGETCFHLAIKNNQTMVVEHLLEWIRERPEFVYLLNRGDYDGNTALHLSCSRKQHQIVRALLSNTSVNVNALNCSGITALDILYVVPYSGKLDIEINTILREAGTKRARDLNKMRTMPTDYDFDKGLSNTLSDTSTAKLTGCYLALLLLMFTTTATITFQAVFHFPASRNKQDSMLFGSFICFNSIAFIVSVAMIIFILHEYPLKPWPQLSISTLFASYMCIIMTKSPNGALPLLLVSIPFLLLAALGKFLVFPSKRSLHSRKPFSSKST